MGKLLVWLLAAGKMGKMLTTGGTMLLSMLAYSWVFGWRYAAGFVLLIFVHEMGHYLAARKRGLAVGAPTFIPFVGAWIEMKQMPHDAETEAFVGLGGPLLGTVGAIGCYFLARSVDAPWLLAVSYAGFFLNLFNLIPVGILDGGAILRSTSWLWRGGGRSKGAVLGGAYIALALLLAIGMYVAHVPQHRL
jgi:Zn-dependent protease